MITSILIISIISFKSSYYYYIIKLTWVERPRLSNTLTACNSLSHPKSCGYLAFAHPRKFISKYQLKNINEMIFTVGFITLMERRWHLSNFMSIQCCYNANIFTSHLNNQENGSLCVHCALAASVFNSRLPISQMFWARLHLLLF